MLYTPNYILSPVSASDKSITSRKETFVLSIDPAKPEELAGIYLSADGIDPAASFFIQLKNAVTAGDKWINELTAFFFLPNYKTMNDAPLLLLDGGTPEGAMMASIITSMVDQGLPQPHIILGGKEATNGITILPSQDTGPVRKAYRQQLSAVPDVSTGLYISVSDGRDMDDIINCLEEAEQEFREQHKDLYLLQQAYQAMEKRVVSSEWLLDAATQEINTLSSHMEILRSAVPARALQNYYNSEYEILPKWYKKFGHVVKVITGKRTFKSLFSGKVKKYKD